MSYILGDCIVINTYHVNIYNIVKRLEDASKQINKCFKMLYAFSAFFNKKINEVLCVKGLYVCLIFIENLFSHFDKKSIAQ